jgi:hypothetical protein
LITKTTDSFTPERMVGKVPWPFFLRVLHLAHPISPEQPPTRKKSRASWALSNQGEVTRRLRTSSSQVRTLQPSVLARRGTSLSLSLDMMRHDDSIRRWTVGCHLRGLQPCAHILLSARTVPNFQKLRAPMPKEAAKFWTECTLKAAPCHASAWASV